MMLCADSDSRRAEVKRALIETCAGTRGPEERRERACAAARFRLLAAALDTKTNQRPCEPVVMTMAKTRILSILGLLFLAASAVAGEADLNLPPLSEVHFNALGGISGYAILYAGLVVCVIGALFGIM